jgi:hypothetical protein
MMNAVWKKEIYNEMKKLAFAEWAEVESAIERLDLGEYKVERANLLPFFECRETFYRATSAFETFTGNVYARCEDYPEYSTMKQILNLNYTEKDVLEEAVRLGRELFIGTLASVDVTIEFINEDGEEEEELIYSIG